MSEQQIELLADIQRLAFSGATQTGYAIHHSYTVHADGLAYSTVQVIDVGAPDEAPPPHYTRANIHPYDDVMSFAQQRDELVDFIAANRKEVAA